MYSHGTKGSLKTAYCVSVELLLLLSLLLLLLLLITFAAINLHVLVMTADKKDLDDAKKRCNELSEKLMEKNRQYLKLQVRL